MHYADLNAGTRFQLEDAAREVIERLPEPFEVAKTEYECACGCGKRVRREVEIGELLEDLSIDHQHFAQILYEAIERAGLHLHYMLHP